MRETRPDPGPLINVENMVKNILIAALFSLVWSTYALAQECLPELSQLAYLKVQQHEKYSDLVLYNSITKGPAAIDENYYAYYIGFGVNTGGRSPRNFHNPKFALLSKDNCEITHVFDLGQGNAWLSPDDIFFSSKENRIIISSRWLERIPDESGTRIKEKVVRNDIGVYDYHNFRLLYKRRFIDGSVPLPDTRGIAKNSFQNDGGYLYLVQPGKIKNIYKFNVENGEFETKTVLDDNYIANTGIEEYRGMQFDENVKEGLGKKGYWNDFEDVPVITLMGKNEAIRYKLNGEPLFVGRVDGEKTFVGSPEQFAKTFGIEIPPLKFVPVTEEEKGVLIAGEFLNQEKGEVAQTESYAEVVKAKPIVEPNSIAKEVPKSDAVRLSSESKPATVGASTGKENQQFVWVVIGGVVTLILLLGGYALYRRRKSDD